MSRLLVAQRALTVPGWAKDALWRRAQAIPSLDLRFADNKSLVNAVTGASLVTFTRASSGTFVNSAGVLQTAATDVPRFDHNPTTGESLGLLVEEQRTNLLLRSEDFSTTWTRTNITAFGSGSATDAAVSPAGTQTADLVAVASGTSAGAGFVGQTVSKAASAITYTYSAFAKADYYDRANLHVNDGATNSNRATVTVSLVNGSIEVAAAAAGTFSAASADVRAFPNGWYRIALTFTTSTETSLLCRLYPANSSADTSDGTRGIFLWGAQLEAGASPTSYIPTTTAAATRAADVASITGTAFSSWYSQSEGTVFASAGVQDFTQTNFPRLFSIDRGDISSNFIAVVRGNNTRRLDYSVFAEGTGQAVGLNNGIAPAANSIVSGAWVYKANDFIGATGGVLTNSDTSGSVPTLLTTLGIGAQGNATLHYNGTIRRLTYWPQRLPNPTLQSITQ